MSYFIIGLLIFFGTHSVRIVADDWRAAQIARLGETPWKLLIGLLSLAGLGLIVWGFALARADSATLWAPPLWAHHTAALLTLATFILLAAAYVPRNAIKASRGHPMVLGVALWALGHLLANGRLVDLLLFGAFFLWAMLDYWASRRRDKVMHVAYPAGTLGNTLLTGVIGIAAWALFLQFLHARWFGVQPFALF